MALQLSFLQEAVLWELLLLKSSPASRVLPAPLTGAAYHACLVADRLPAGTVDLILAYCHNSLNDTSLQEWVPYLKKQEVAIVSASPMSMGLMTTKVGMLLLRSTHSEQHILLVTAMLRTYSCYHATTPAAAAFQVCYWHYRLACFSTCQTCCSSIAPCVPLAPILRVIWRGCNRPVMLLDDDLIMQQSNSKHM